MGLGSVSIWDFFKSHCFLLGVRRCPTYQEPGGSVAGAILSLPVVSRAPSTTQAASLVFLLLPRVPLGPAAAWPSRV